MKERKDKRDEGWIKEKKGERMNKWMNKFTVNKPSEQFHAKGNIEQDT